MTTRTPKYFAQYQVNGKWNDIMFSGRPTEARCADFRAKLAESFGPGGCNAHVYGQAVEVGAFRVIENETGNIVREVR